MCCPLQTALQHRQSHVWVAGKSLGCGSAIEHGSKFWQPAAKRHRETSRSLKSRLKRVAVLSKKLTVKECGKLVVPCRINTDS